MTPGKAFSSRADQRQRDRHRRLLREMIEVNVHPAADPVYELAEACEQAILGRILLL